MVYYYSDYWRTWDEIIGWDQEHRQFIVRSIGTNEIRQHSTTLKKCNLSLTMELGNNPGKCWAILRDIGVPYNMIQF